MPGVTSKTGSKYDAIPGPLGLASASLEGKVALVTGAGKWPFLDTISSIAMSRSSSFQPGVVTSSKHGTGNPTGSPKSPTALQPISALTFPLAF